jgi:hypothetical protein
VTDDPGAGLARRDPVRGAAAYARGAGPPEHDVDFVTCPGAVPAAVAALAGAGLRVEEPPEGWLVKGFDGDHMLDLI